MQLNKKMRHNKDTKSKDQLNTNINDLLRHNRRNCDLKKLRVATASSKSTHLIEISTGMASSSVTDQVWEKISIVRLFHVNSWTARKPPWTPKQYWEVWLHCMCERGAYNEWYAKKNGFRITTKGCFRIVFPLLLLYILFVSRCWNALVFFSKI